MQDGNSIRFDKMVWKTTVFYNIGCGKPCGNCGKHCIFKVLRRFKTNVPVENFFTVNYKFDFSILAILT